MDKEQQAKTEAPAAPAPAPAAPAAPAAAKKESSGLAIASMVVGILTLVLFCWWAIGFGFIMAVVAIVLGIISLKKKAGGKGMAIAGIVTGGVSVVWNGIVTIMFIIGLMMLGAASSSLKTAANEITATANSYTETQQARVDAKKNFTKGQTATFDDFSVKVNSVTRNYTPSESYYAADDGKELIVVNVTVKNLDTESHYFSSYDLDIVEDGLANSSSYFGDVEDEFEGGTLAAGASTTGNIVYEVTKDATGLKLQYETYGYDPSESESVTLTYTLAI